MFCQKNLPVDQQAYKAKFVLVKIFSAFAQVRD